MTFPGIKSPQQRADLIAFLKKTNEPPTAKAAQMQMGGMGGMMNNKVPNLKKLDTASRVENVRYCRDTYEVTTADGKKQKFWERNLRFKTDSGEDGPTKGAPALVAAGMAGDRADVIFADPSEFASFVAAKC